MENTKKFYSIEYNDFDGDRIIKHVLADSAEINSLLMKFKESRIEVKIHSLDPDLVPDQSLLTQSN